MAVVIFFTLVPRAFPDERWSHLSSPLFDQITADVGLPDNAVTALVQDHDGFIWIGTQGGLARYDGYRFRVFHYDPADSASLPDDFVLRLYVDSSNTLWVTTATAGMARFDREHERFVRYGAGPGGLSAPNVTSVVGDGGSGLWIGTEHGLDHLDPSTGAIRSYHHSAADPASLPDDSILSLCLDAGNTLWMGTQSGLARFDPVRSRFQAIRIPGRDGKLISDRVWEVTADSRKTIWFGTDRYGLGSVGAKGTAQLLGTLDASSDLRHASVRAITEVRNGLLWIATYGGGVFSLDLTSHAISRMQHEPEVPGSLGDDQDLALLRDQSGLIWVGTEQGLSRSDPGNLAIQSIFSNRSRSDRLCEPNAVSTMITRDGNLWVGYHGCGVDVFSPDGHRVAAIRPGSTRARALPRRSVSALAEGEDGTVWIGTTVGLYQTTTRANKVAQVPIPIPEGYSFIQAIRVRKDGIWVGTNAGVLHYEPGKRTWRAFTSADPIGPLTDNRITTIFPRADGRLWVGTLHGLNLLDPVQGVVERVQAAPSDRFGLSSNYVTDMTEDSVGRLWVGTGGGGINVLHSRDSQGRPQFLHIGRAEGLPNASVDALQPDKQGRIWASTDYGMAMITTDTLQARAFHRPEGVPFRNYWNQSSAATAQGDLLFGALGGLTVVHPELVTRREFLPPIVVTEIRIGTRLQAAATSGAGATEPIVVTAKDRGFQVEFAALDYAAPLRNRYAYKLEGFDHDWIETDSTRRVASYTSLPPGHYRLLLRASSDPDSWNATGLALPVQVEPAWFQTMTFRILEIAAGLCLVIAVVRSRTAYLGRQQRELETIVATRTEELRLSNEKLYQSKKRLEEIAFLDALTGLPNRRLFSQRFDYLRAAARRDGRRFALIMLDLDNFKDINDTYGHAAGDEVLIEAAHRLRMAMRDVDFVARLGGDEFAILLDGTCDPIFVEMVCMRIIHSFRSPIRIGDRILTASITLGAAIHPGRDVEERTLCHCADLALYEAKAAGRNTWRCFRDAGPKPSVGAATSSH
ncbi:MAG: two-component regulator propeller domain-containing protein [Candidatus Sulfotelmatobacter sp.]